MMMAPLKGFLLIDKPKNWTSFDVVGKIRRWSGERHVGHAGTLDSLATGLLILAIGEATKFLEYLIGCDKEYEVSARFGATSETYDAEGPILGIENFDAGKIMNQLSSHGVLALIEKSIKDFFLGEIEQIPPSYSALKIAGKRASDRVRGGELVQMKSRKITIESFEVLNLEWPEATFRVKCSSGTYIRSLVHDLGQKLGWGAYVQELRRIKIWNFNVEEALAISPDGDFMSKNIDQYLIDPEIFLKDFERVEITDEEFTDLANGKEISSNKVVRGEPVLAYCRDKIVGIFAPQRQVGVLKFRKLIHSCFFSPG